MRVIGVGAFGMVRLVKHKKSGKPYALKVGSKKEMRLETEILRSLDQRNINRLEATYDVVRRPIWFSSFFRVVISLPRSVNTVPLRYQSVRYYAASVVLAFQNSCRGGRLSRFEIGKSRSRFQGYTENC